MSTESQPTCVTEYLSEDHRRLDAILSEALLLTEQPATVADAARRFGQFRSGLLRHIEIEEQILFPAFEEATGMSGGGPTMVMRMEHKSIRELLDRIDGALARGEGSEASWGIEELVDLMGGHNGKEEHVLYPMSDEIAGDADARAALVARMRRS